MLSTQTAETDNHGQGQTDGAQEDLLPDDMEDLSEHGEEVSVTKDSSPSDSKQNRNSYSHKSQQGLIVLCETTIHQIF